jgi:hypothetical protein
MNRPLQNPGGFLGLPTELTYLILRLTSGEDFEALMLTCSTIYQIGAPLITEHKFCKSWTPNFESVPSPAYYELRSVAYMLDQVIELPLDRSQKILQYVQKVYWVDDTLRSIWDNPFSLGRDTIHLKAPWLHQKFEQIASAISDIKFSTDGCLLFNANEQVARRRASELEVLPAGIALLLFPNLKRLFIGTPLPSAIPMLIDHFRGDVYFQNLRVVSFTWTGTTGNTLQDMAPILLLPKLASVILYNFYGWADENDGKNRSVFLKWPYGNRNSNVTNWTFMESRADSGSIIDFLTQFSPLKTFVWEDKRRLVLNRN